LTREFYNLASDGSLFSSFSHPKIRHVVTLANGSKVTSQGVGQISLSPSLNLKHVLLVLNCAFNLISSSQLTKSLKCCISFDANSFVIQECVTCQLIDEGHESGGLYCLGIRPLVSCLAFASPNVLHDRLGHPHLSKLKRMIHELNKLQILECQSWQLGNLFGLLFKQELKQDATLSFHNSI